MITVPVTVQDREVLLNGFSKDWPGEVLNYVFGSKSASSAYTQASQKKDASQKDQELTAADYHCDPVRAHMKKVMLKRFLKMSSQNIEGPAYSGAEGSAEGYAKMLEIVFQKHSFETRVYARSPFLPDEIRGNIAGITGDITPLLMNYFSNRAKGIASEVATVDLSQYARVVTK